MNSEHVLKKRIKLKSISNYRIPAFSLDISSISIQLPIYGYTRIKTILENILQTILIFFNKQTNR